MWFSSLHEYDAEYDDDAKEEENEDDCLLLRAHRVTWTNDFCIHFTRFIHLIFSWAVWDGGCSLLLTCSYVRACQLRSGWFEIFIEKSENPQARAIYDDEKKKKKKKKKKRCRRDDYSRLWWSMTLFACLLREKGKEYPSVCVCTLLSCVMCRCCCRCRIRLYKRPWCDSSHLSSPLLPDDLLYTQRERESMFKGMNKLN